jgi:hypothetical protein
MLEISEIHNFKVYNRAIAKKTQHGAGTKTDMKTKWNRMEDPDVNPHNYAHLIFDKGETNI